MEVQMRKLAVFGAFLTIAVWSGPLAACPSYMVLTCAERAAATPKLAEKRGWTSRQARIFTNQPKDIDALVWKGRIETYEPTGRVRVYDSEGDLVRDFRFLMPDYITGGQ